MTAPSEPTNDLVMPEGVNSGSAASERDRDRSGSDPTASGTELGGPVRDAPPPDRLVGPPTQDGDEPGQELAAGEG